MDEEYYNLPTDTADKPYEVFDLNMQDSQLIQMVGKSLKTSIDHWNKEPYSLEKADTLNLKYWLGQQMTDQYIGPDGKPLPNMGNRMMTSTRAVLAYVNSQVARPEVAPSSGEETAKQFAKDIRSAMYQHSIDQNLKAKAKKSTQNLVVQKRGYLLLRFDPTIGPNGDIAVDHVAPEDIVLDEATVWGEDPPRFWRKQRCSIEELINKFPAKEQAIKAHFDIQRGIVSQMNKRIMYWECWFTYYDKGQRKEGLVWFLENAQFVLGKMENPNYIYTGDPIQDRIVNFLPFPIKPLITFSYMSSGKSGVDETSLFEQAKIPQDLYNKRRVQIMRSNDRQRGKTIVDARAADEQDVKKFLLGNNDQSVLMIKPQDGTSVGNSVVHVPYNPLPQQATDEAYDYRNEVDTVMGTPNIFRGEQSKNNTLGQDERIIEQAGALQDDLASSIDEAMQQYYRKLFHMMKVYYDENHWFTLKGDNGKYDFVVMSSESMDTNVKISIEAGSTTPQSAKDIRSIAIDAAGAGKIDDLSFWEAIVYGKLPDPETIVERLQKQNADPAAFMRDVETQTFNREAAIDIALIIASQEPPVRDEYGQAYLEYFNKFIMSNKFMALPEQTQEVIKIHLAAAGATAARTANLQMTQLDDAAEAGVQEDQVATAME